MHQGVETGWHVRIVNTYNILGTHQFPFIIKWHTDANMAPKHGGCTLLSCCLKNLLCALSLILWWDVIQELKGWEKEREMETDFRLDLHYHLWLPHTHTHSLAQVIDCLHGEVVLSWCCGQHLFSMCVYLFVLSSISCHSERGSSSFFFFFGSVTVCGFDNNYWHKPWCLSCMFGYICMSMFKHMIVYNVSCW